MSEKERNFCSRRRFETLPTIFYAASSLNPDKSNRDMMSSDEKVEARSCLETSSERVETRDSIEVTDVNVVETDSDGNIELICRASTFKRAEPLNVNFEEELRSFENTIDEKMSAFSFFKRDDAGAQFPLIRRVARIGLCVLPSPAVSERAFSRAQFFLKLEKIGCQWKASNSDLNACVNSYFLFSVSVF